MLNEDTKAMLQEMFAIDICTIPYNILFDLAAE